MDALRKGAGLEPVEGMADMNRTPRALQWSALVLLAPVLAACESSTPAVPDGTDDAGRDQTDDAAIDSFPPPACGNDTAEPGEACDGTDLGAFDTCEDFPGFVSGGSVGCRPDCSGYDLSGCIAGTTTTLGSCDLAVVQAAADGV